MNHTQRRWASVAAALLFSAAAFAGTFPDAHESAPAGWTGHVFRLSQAYPTTPPSADARPWQEYDVKKEPEQYIAAVYKYVLAGNIEVDWEVDRNAVRKWYHAPWMHTGDNGREFVHGLTRERTTPAPAAGKSGELGPSQTQCAQNWAVGFYNAPGGYIVGQVWANPIAPDAGKSRFPDGTVVAKLLFTAAPIAQVPYLAGSYEWQANIHVIPKTDTKCQTRGARAVQTVRLLQMDLAIRDTSAHTTTEWVFATYTFDGTKSGTSPWAKMVPVGVMWGNDPSLTPTTFAAGQRVMETWVNSRLKTLQHLGWLGRLDGPVDNASSSCLSCHATGQVPASSPMLPPAGSVESVQMRWFLNYPAATPFDSTSVSTDYSLQLAAGIQAFRAASQPGGFAALTGRSKGIDGINKAREYVVSRGD